MPLLYKRLTWICDLIILNTCCLTVLLAWFEEPDWLWGLSLLNCIAVIALRHWLMKSLQIPWLVSILNRALRRTAGIGVSLLFLLTLFPLIIVVQALIAKCSRKHEWGGLFSIAEVQTADGKHLPALVFSNCAIGDCSFLNMTPLALMLLTGTISLDDLPYLTITDIKAITAEKATEDNNIVESNKLATPQEATEYDSNKTNIISD